MLIKKIERPKEGRCGLSMICPRCGCGYTCGQVSICNQGVLICDKCEDEIIDFINQHPQR